MLLFALGAWAIAVFNIAVSWELVLHRPFSGLARAYLLWTVCITLWALGYGVTVSSLLSYGVTLEWNRWCQAMAALIAPCFFNFCCLVVGYDGSRSRLLPIYVLISSALSLAVLLDPRYVIGLWTMGPFGYQPLGGDRYWLFATVFWFITIHGFWVVWRYRSHQPAESARRLDAFLLGTAIAYVGGASLFVQPFGIALPPIGIFFLLAYHVSFGYAIYRFQFLNLPKLLSRSICYSLLVGLVTSLLFAAASLAGRVWQGYLRRDSLGTTVAVAFLTAMFLEPVRALLQRAVDRVLFSATPVELADQRERLLEEVRQVERMRAVSTLAAGLAHEIKNPLASIKTFTEHLEDNHADPEFRQKFQRIVGGEVDRINHIVHQLLDFARPQPLKLMPLDVTKLLDETLDLMSRDLLRRHVEVERHYSGNTMVRGDRQRLKQAFLNILLNSLEAMNGTGIVRISTRSELNCEISVSIEDNGRGIQAQDLPHIFEPFFTSKPCGTGLGLAVVKRIVTEHGGRIWIHSRPGAGATVHLAIPSHCDSASSSI